MISQVLWDAYCTTTLGYDGQDDKHVNLIPTADEYGDWPWGEELLEVFIISAANPYSEKLTDQENFKREQLLEADLDSAGFKYLPCRGQSPDGQWVEQSLLVIGAHLPSIRTFGAKYSQNAVFRWTPSTWECVSLISEQHFVTGWKLIF